MTATYFLVYRYQRDRRGDVIDGNTVMSFDDVVTTEREIRGIEALIAEEKGVSAELVGLVNLVRLE